MAEVDNIEAVRKNILKFEKEGDFFVVHIIRRKKDESGGDVCGDDDARLIKTYYIDNLEYFDRKIPAIKNMCVLNSARAYILPYRRNKLTINRAMLKKVVDEIDNAHDGMTVLYIPDFDNKEREIGAGEVLDKVLGYLADHHSNVHAEIMSKMELLREI